MLHKPFDNYSSFIMLDGSTEVIFNFEYPFTNDGMMTRRKRNHGPCNVVYKSIKFYLHCFNPVRIMTGLLIICWFYKVRNIMYKFSMSNREIRVSNNAWLTW